MKTLPALVLMALAAATAVDAADAAELTIAVKSSKGEPVADAVVSLTPLDARVPPPPPDTAGEIAQKDQEFTTYVTVAQAGSRVVFPNKDTVQHHVYSLSKAKKFELPLYNPGAAKSFVFDVPGLVTLGCNIHDWMLAYLVVVPTPYFAKTDGAGAARVTAPVGRYRLELWHPRLAAAVTQELALADGAAATRAFTLTLKRDRRIRRESEPSSSGYR